MSTDIVEEFAKYLATKNSIAGELAAKLNSSNGRGSEKRLRDLWELTGLSANDFADDVAQFYRLPRVTLLQLLAASSLVARFSRRFLRETTVFPYQAVDSSFRLVVADPSDGAAVRAAEIVLGTSVQVEVASFEDLAIVLADRLGEDIAAASEPGE